MSNFGASSSELLRLIGDVYDCAIAPEKWPETLEQISQAIHVDFTGIALYDTNTRAIRVKLESGVPAATTAAMIAGAPFNPVLSAFWFVALDEPFTSASYMGETEWRQSRFRREVTAPLGYDDAIMTLISKTGQLTGAITMPRRPEFGPITAADLAWVREIAPHIRRAVAIADLLEVRSLESTMLSDTLDLLAVAVFLVDDLGRIAHVNKQGQALLDAKDALLKQGDHLAARDAGSHHELKQALTSAAVRAVMPATGIAIPLRSVRKGADLAAWVLPLDSGLRSSFGVPFTASLAVFVRELGDTRPFPGELFIKRFAITAGECRVLMMLVNGLSPVEVADALGNSVATVKTHMSRLFEKTGTTGQSDLMRLAVSAMSPASASPLK